MDEPFQKINPSLLTVNQWQQYTGLVAGITSRQGGVSNGPFSTFNLGFHVPDHEKHVRNNREILADMLGFSVGNWVMGEQVHRTEVAVVTSKDQTKGAYKHGDALSGYDGLITNQQGLLLTSLFADCVPIYFYDPISKWIGIAHAGWRGSVNGMATNMIMELENQGVQPENILVAIGPSISGSVYEVDEKVVQNIPLQFHEHVMQQQSNGHFLLDLRQLNFQLLRQCGVMPDHISVTSYCTYSNPDLFFSHRRDQGNTGRMLGFIGISAHD